ncbi:MAG: epoxyqueuosine reductase QueH [Firmicutes bacterium]|nr:epoxyqueuosine reductase QueH [Bacillota bacterium]
MFTQEKTVENNAVKSLLLHSCCAPCSSSVLERLAGSFDVTVYFYNPNIYPQSEYDKRASQQADFIKKFKTSNIKNCIIEQYDNSVFFESVKGLEAEKEGGERCFNCYLLRMEKTAALAAEKGMDYFTTTLSVSPYKNAKKLNEIGVALAEKYGVGYLYSDFKKKDGYKRSIELSAKYNLYRQNYCGCIYSIKD